MVFFKRLIWVLLLVVFSRAYAAGNDILLTAQNMLATGQSVEALDLLAPYEDELAGDKDFDYLFGLALYDTGDAASAVFAFQRILSIDPNFAGARLELARSFYEMGQLQRAQKEFKTLERQSPPANVQLVIDKYLSSIEAKNLQNRRGWSGFLKLGLGNDTNVNNATENESFLGFDLSEESKAKSSSVLTTLGGVRYDLPLSVDNKLLFKGSVNQRSNNSASFTNTLNYNVLAGYTQTLSSGHDFSVSLQAYSADVDGSFNNKGKNLTGQFNLNLSGNNQFGFFVRNGTVEYAEQFKTKDITQTLTGISWTHVFSGVTRVSLVSSILLGKDKAVETNSPYGRDYSGLRLSAAYPITHRVNLFASVGSTASFYDGGFFGSTEDREDTQVDYSFGSSWRVNKTWTLKALIGSVRATSNIDIFQYDKNIIMLSARSEFIP